jgi:hypothetical protein
MCLLGPLRLCPHALSTVLAIAAGFALLHRSARVWSIPGGPAVDAALTGLLVGVLAGRAEVLLVNLRYFLERPARALVLSYGGLGHRSLMVFGVGAAVLAFRRHGNISQFLCCLTAPLAGGSAIAWAGALWAGHWASMPAESPLALTLPDQYGVLAPRLPIQLVPALVSAAWVPFTLTAPQRGHRTLHPLLAWALSMAAARAPLAFLRADVSLFLGLPRPFFADLGMAAALALAMVLTRSASDRQTQCLEVKQ